MKSDFEDYKRSNNLLYGNKFLVTAIRHTFNKKKNSMENFIVSKKYQKFFINKKKFYFKKGEKIQVEISNKFTISNFSKLAKSSGWNVIKHWKDTKKYYAVFLLQT